MNFMEFVCSTMKKMTPYWWRLSVGFSCLMHQMLCAEEKLLPSVVQRMRISVSANTAEANNSTDGP